MARLFLALENCGDHNPIWLCPLENAPTNLQKRETVIFHAESVFSWIFPLTILTKCGSIVTSNEEGVNGMFFKGYHYYFFTKGCPFSLKTR